MELELIDKIMSREKDQITEAFCKIQKLLPNVIKDKKVFGRDGSLKYSYTELVEYIEASKDILADNKLTVNQPLKYVDGANILCTIVSHTSGQWLLSTVNLDLITTRAEQAFLDALKELPALERIKILRTYNPAQQFGGLVSYMRRYCYASALRMGQDDDDAQGLTKRHAIEEKAMALLPVQKLVSLCKEHSIDAKEFAKFHHIEKERPETVIGAVSNFVSLKKEFLDGRHNNTH